VPTTQPPEISVIIPTYNRRDMLLQALESMTAQAAAAPFEVIVADDGSTDGTEGLVRSFSGRLRLRYHFQEDRGFRVAAARNAGARLARAPVLAFLDAGTVAGPGFVQGHLGAHAAAGGPLAVIGYCYGYQPLGEPEWLAGELAALGPLDTARRHAADPSFADLRHDLFATVSFDAGRLAAPWYLFWCMNCSVSARAFWEAGGFDEAYESWGGEDTELGYRLFERGVPFAIAREPWTVELPHQRRLKSMRHSLMRNARYFLRKHPNPIAEITRDAFNYADLGLVESGAAALAAWQERAAGLDVLPELERAAAALPTGASAAVFGCGQAVPAALPPCVLFDFDAGLLARALADGRHTGYHGLGIRTPLRAGGVDAVIITSRLAGLWDRWGHLITAEAQRIGARLLLPARGSGPPMPHPALAVKGAALARTDLPAG
jgi:glycosyltransferase involved in cell wall biosynthesis